MEFLIRRADGEWFDLHKRQFPEAFVPSSFPSKPVEGWGDYRIEINGCQISFSYEDPGIQVCFEGASLSATEAAKIVGEVAENISKVTGQKARIVPL
jgi:hypothetical protein